jgi:hypothetical protein
VITLIIYFSKRNGGNALMLAAERDKEREDIKLRKLRKHSLLEKRGRDQNGGPLGFPY